MPFGATDFTGLGPTRVVGSRSHYTLGIGQSQSLQGADVLVSVTVRALRLLVSSGTVVVSVALVISLD